MAPQTPPIELGSEMPPVGAAPTPDSAPLSAPPKETTEAAQSGAQQTLADVLRSAPPWLVSFIAHGVLVVCLAICTIRLPEGDTLLTLVSDPAAHSEPLQQEVQLEQLDPSQETAELASAAMESLTTADLVSEIGGLGDLGEASLESPVAPASFGQADAMFGEDLRGMSELDGAAGGASFFGVKSKGERFAFVVDNSNSMNGGKFEMALDELLVALRRLRDDQFFYIVFYSDTAYPMFHPDTANTMLPATEENVDRIEYWLHGVHRCLKTEGRDAMRLALSLRPDVVYLLGDGSFTDDTVKRTLATRVPGLTIHTLGFRMKERARAGMELIAKHYRGRFTDVEVSAEMKARSKQRRRPHDRFRNGVWGLKLPPSGDGS